MPSTGHKARPRTRVRTRLLAIVLVPALGLSAITAREAAVRVQVADGSQELAASVARVSELAPIALMITREVYLVSAAYAGHTFGLSPKQVTVLLGIDVEEELADLRASMDERFAALAPGDPALAFRDRVHEIRAGEASGDIPPENVGYELGFVTDDTYAAAISSLDEAERGALDLEGSARVLRALAGLRAAGDASEAAFEQLAALALLFGGMLGADPSGTTPEDRLRELRQGTATLEAGAEDLDRLAFGSVADTWHALRDDPEVRANEAEMVAIGEGGALPSSVDDLAQLFRQTMDRMTRYFGLTELAASVAVDEADALGDDATERLRQSVAVAVTLILSTIVVAALIARSISRPLRQLEAGAKRVSAGDLAGYEPPRQGPREVVAVSTTLAEAVDNLRAVEGQLGTLAAGDVDDGVLGRPVPGRLGALLHEALGRLSHSIGERDALGRRLHHEATHDPLTGLPNRAAAGEELRRALARAQRAGTTVGVLYIDLDGFKHVNDHHGHDAGDTMLRAVAERLAAGVRAGDHVSRIGGDEFLVITEVEADPAAVVRLGERLVAAVSEPVPIGVGATRVGASVGIAFTADGQLDADAVLREADLAAYRAKAVGRGRVQLFDEHLRAEVERRSDLERALRQAVEDDALELHFQPVVGQDGSGVNSVEALLRWNRPGVGPVSPGEFIPVAEAGDLIIDVDRWVLRKACAQLAAWRGDPDLGGLSISVNLSGRHLLNLNVVDNVRDAIERSGADPELLSVEITETVLLKEMPVVVEHLERIRALGVRVAIDDFGTGYTSLAHLRTLPADVLKIDRSLVIAAGSAPDSHVLRLVVGTAHALGMRLVAEGVETSEQLAHVQAMGCDLVQGFLFARPTPAGELRAALAALRGAVSR